MRIRWFKIIAIKIIALAALQNPAFCDEASNYLTGNSHKAAIEEIARAAEAAKTYRPLIDGTARASGNPLLDDAYKERRAAIAERREGARRAPSKYLVFATLGLGKAELKELFVRYAGRDDVSIVFRGILDGDTLPLAMQRIRGLFPEDQQPPNVYLNPTLFREYAVDTVPTIILVDVDENRAIARVAGITNTDYIKERVKTPAGKKGDIIDFGVAGPTVEFAEQDLIAMLMARANNLDWEEMKSRALSRAVKNQAQHPLPKNSEVKSTVVDLRVRAPSAIKDSTGRILVDKGEILDPLKYRAFDITVMVFNGRDDKEVAWVRQKMESGEWKNISLIASEFDADNGFDGYAALTYSLGKQVSILNKEVADRFGIRGTPSMLYGKDGQVIRYEDVAE